MINTASLSEKPTEKGILYLILGLAIFSLQDVVMKFFSGEIALQEVIFLRGFVTILITSFLIVASGNRSAFRTRQPVLCVLRGLAGFSCFTAFSMALAVLPLANAMPLYYTSPLFVVALSIPLLGESVGFRSWLAILIGFAGVVLIAHPQAQGIDPAIILALGSAVAYAMQSLLTRKLGPSETALSMTFYSQLTFIAMSGLTGLIFGSGWLNNFDHPSAQYLFRAWEMPSTGQAGLIVAIGLLAAIGFLCITQAYRLGRASIIAPFEYSSLPFAVLWGWLFWNSLPGLMTILGNILIVFGGFYAIQRELVTGRNLLRRRFPRR